MGMLVVMSAIALGAIIIGAAGGIIAGRSHQFVLPMAGTIVCYFILVGIPWAILIAEPGGDWLRSFSEAFVALARSLLPLGLVPLLILFAISAWIAR